jgi:hypothetical protein
MNDKEVNLAPLGAGVEPEEQDVAFLMLCCQSRPLCYPESGSHDASTSAGQFSTCNLEIYFTYLACALVDDKSGYPVKLGAAKWY